MMKSLWPALLLASLAVVAQAQTNQSHPLGDFENPTVIVVTIERTQTMTLSEAEALYEKQPKDQSLRTALAIAIGTAPCRPSEFSVRTRTERGRSCRAQRRAGLL